ncbi:Topoisomerase I damage affected protein 7 [Lasiodiplodia theobromae]|uniref:Topoisomerase I damage affected protein 7 n=1 Tax=Lasiodiplodia theobromae TaxID=45133 RepID=A0A5N5DEQ9_9PEZI|nr:Topoisomerase I damage affected protein 7 [Lasiodiplodia theobromae]
MRSLSCPLACMAFLLLFFLGVHAGNAGSSNAVCLSAFAPECQWPVSEHTKAACCPADRPICTSVMGHLGCYSQDVIPRDDGYPYSTITLDFGDNAETSTTSTSSGNGWMTITWNPFESFTPVPITGHWTAWPSSRASQTASPALPSSVTTSSTASSEVISSPTTSARTLSSGAPTAISSSLSTESSHTDDVKPSTKTVTASPSTVTVNSSISAHDIDCTTSSDYIVVSGHYTGSVASRTTTYSHDATPRTTGPYFSEYTETVWYTGGRRNTWSWSTLNRQAPTAAVAARELTSISLAKSDVMTVTVKNAETTYPLALITNSAVSIPSSCQRLLTGTGSAGTPLYYTYVARECTGASTTTISSTSTTTLTSIFGSVESAGVAAETSMSFDLAPSSELDKTTVSTTIAGTCASASTITITVQETPSTSTVTAFYNTTVIGSITTSSLVITSSDPSSSSSESSDPSSTADAVTTGDPMSSTVLSSSMPSIFTPPTTPTTPLASNTPGTPAPTVFGGGAGVVQVNHGMLTILAFAFFIFQ